MVTRDTAWPAGTPCWADLGVADIPLARDFYAGLFGWSIREGPPESGGYSMCELGGRAVAGIGPKAGPPDAPSVWTTYLATDDADETASEIKAAGGDMLAEPFDVMDVGRMGIALDPAGAAFGVWQARRHTGFGVANEPGSVCWNEQLSREFDRSKAFYHAVFGYDYGDMSSADFQYATIELGSQVVGGIGALGPAAADEVPAHWSTYFAVADTDAALARVAELGGTVLRPAWDTPYGRMAVVSDDQGAVFSLLAIAWAEASEA
jgi:uncharacterized protein